MKGNIELTFSEIYCIPTSPYETKLISDLPLSNRTLLALQRNHIHTISDLLNTNSKILLSSEGLGSNAINEIELAISSIQPNVVLEEILDLSLEQFYTVPVVKLGLDSEIFAWLIEKEIHILKELVLLSPKEIMELFGYREPYLASIVNSIKCFVNSHREDSKSKPSLESQILNMRIEDIHFTIRTQNRLLKNGITTVSDLIQTPIQTLAEIQGFGAACIKEVEEYLQSIGNINVTKETLNSELKTRRPIDISKVALEHKNQIMNGVFSFLPCLDEEDKEKVEIYKEAHEVLGQDMVSICVENTDELNNIIALLNTLADSQENYINLCKLVDSIPYARRYCKAEGFINTFTQDDQEKTLLLLLANDGNSLLKNIINNEASLYSQNFILVQRFLKWCSYDLKAEIQSVLNTALSSERLREVITARAKGETLNEVGNALGVTRERVRQIETKAKKLFARGQARIRIISKISAEHNGISIIYPEMVSEYVSEYAEELLYFLKTVKSNYYSYDKQHDVFIYGDSSLGERIQDYVDSLPDTIKPDSLDNILSIAAEEEDFPEELVKKAISDSYRLTGEVYHRSRLSMSSIYQSIMEEYFPNGFKPCDSNQMARFKSLILQEYGSNLHLPKNDRAIVARIQDVAIVCDRGTYIVRNKQSHLPQTLAKKIYDYIKTSKNKVFLTNTLFSIFEDELLNAGINNKYYLQAVLRDLYEDEFIFRRDYISRDASFTTVHTEIINFIKKSNYPVSKQEIHDSFPGLTEIVLSFAVDDNSIINLFGKYLHSSKLKISAEETERFRAIISELISDGKPHHGEELFARVNSELPGVLSRNFAMYPFCAYSIAECLFRDDFQFSRPLIAQNGIDDIGYPIERLKDHIYKHNRISFEDISLYSKDIHFQIYSFLELAESMNDRYLILNEKEIIDIELTGITEEIAKQVEAIIANSVRSTTPIRDLPCIYSLPQVSVNWTEWLVFSTLKKWATTLTVATSSPRLKLAVPLVAPSGEMNIEEFANLQASKNTEFNSNSIDELNTDDILMELIDDDSLWED